MVGVPEKPLIPYTNCGTIGLSVFESLVRCDVRDSIKEEAVKRGGTKHKYFVVVAVVMSIMVFAMPILAQQDDMAAGRAAGEQAARASVNGTLWLAAGCLFGVLGLVAAYVYEPTPPATELLGKSAEYVTAYTEAYKQTAKSIQTNKALAGCAVGCIANVALGLSLALITEPWD